MATTSRFRFSLRTLFISIAALALTIGLGPSLWRHYAFRRALEGCIEHGPDRKWVYTLDGEWEPVTEFAELSQERDWAADRLLEAVVSDSDPKRRQNALATIRALEWVPGRDFQREYLDELVRIATTEVNLDRAFESSLTQTIAYWIPFVDVGESERETLIARARSATPMTRPSWVCILSALGGREETLLLLEWAEQDDQVLLTALGQYEFRSSAWRGMLPHVERWLDRPTVAHAALDHAVLFYSVEGRRKLLEVALDSDRPRKQRISGLESLQASVAGNELLLAATTNEIATRELGALLGGDPKALIRAKIEELKDAYGEQFWRNEIAGLSKTPFTHPSIVDPAIVVKGEQMDRDSQQASLLRLRLLSGRFDLTTEDDWNVWLASAKPDRIPLSRLLQLFIDHPSTLMAQHILARVEGEIQPECRPLYDKMLDHENERIRYWAAAGLLRFGEEWKAAEVLIELIEESPDPHGDRHSQGATRALQSRFAVNFFNDRNAWRKWLAEARTDGQ